MVRPVGRCLGTVPASVSIAFAESDRNSVPSPVLRDHSAFPDANAHPDRDAHAHTDGRTHRDSPSNFHRYAYTYGTADTDAYPDAESDADSRSDATESRPRRRRVVRVDSDDRIRRVDLASLPQLRLL